MRQSRGRHVTVVSLALLLAVLLLAAGVGSVHVGVTEGGRILLARLFGLHLGPDWPVTHETILWSIRLPRVLLGALVGMALSVAGGAFQGLFRNPLADPYVLGVSGGASLGAALAIAFLNHMAVRGLGVVPLFAFAGGLLSALVVYRLAAVGSRVPVVALLLAGVAVGSLASSLVSLILFVTEPLQRDTIIFWMMGGLSGANWAKVGWLLPYLLVGAGVLLFYSRQLNALLMGEETARHLGVDVERLRRLVLVVGSLLTAAAVAFAGAIGFVGLIVPHVVRFLVGPDHRFLLPVSALVGATVLVGADTLARTLLPATEIPVGLVMALLGGPFFLWLLRRKLAGAQ
ncbi:MAG: FecCD family ABC transporter permease [Mycobacterium leprae]